MISLTLDLCLLLNQHFFINNRGFTDIYHSGKVHANEEIACINYYFDTLRDGASFRRLALFCAKYFCIESTGNV